jgi:proteic killer suppression protein
MIIDFACKDTKKVFQGKYTKKWSAEVRKKGQMKLDILDASITYKDLKIPPSNRFHPLTDDLKGFHSISINKQWRIIFQWNEGNASKVKITDYHK